jgi:TRAP-type transport system periplasmic protein
VAAQWSHKSEEAEMITTSTAVALAIGISWVGFGAAPTASSTTPVDAVTLTIGTNDGADGPMAVPIEEFARQVDELSGGSVTIEPVWSAGPPDTPTIDDYIAWDQFVARRVVSGELDMGMIPARAWDTEGVNTLRALFAPFLVDSDALVAAIVSDPDLTADLLAGLDDAGITGLALLPESLRHVFSFSEPLLSPDDFAGTIIRAPYSATTYALIEALGATGADLVGSEFDEGISDGSVGGAESAFARAMSLPGAELATATGNVTPYANVNSLVINTEASEGLSSDQQAVLREAAALTLDAILSGLVDEATAAAQFCAAGGAIVLAGEDDLAALAAAAQPVLDELMSDESTAALIERIGALKADLPVLESVAACERPAASDAVTPTSEVAATPSATIPSGTYRRTVNRADAEALGIDESFIATEIGPDNELDVAFVFADDGRWTQLADYSGTGVLESGDFGTYTYDDAGRLVTTSNNTGCRGCVGVFEWTFADGVLTLALVPHEGQERPYDPIEILMTDGEYVQQD